MGALGYFRPKAGGLEICTKGIVLAKQRVILKSMRSSRKDAYTFLIGSILFLVFLCLDNQRLGLGQVGTVCTVIFLCIGVLLGALNLLPEHFWVYGIELKQDGFVFHEQLRRTKFIRYCAIHRIVVTSMIDGGGESSCTVRVMSTDGNARLEENLLYSTDVLSELKQLPGFNLDAWSKSDVPEGSLRWSLMSKKTVVLARPIP